MIDKVKVELPLLTRELAQEFKDLQPMPGERKLRQSRTNALHKLLVDKAFNSPEWHKAIIDESGQEYRADGQHTSNLLATCEESLFPQGLKVTVTTWRCEMDDLAALFDMFNNPLSARSNTDKLGIYIAPYSDLTEMDHTFLARIAHGIDYYYRSLEESAQGVTVWPQRQHGLYFRDPTHRLFVHFLYILREAKHVWMFSKPGIVAEIFGDWQSHRDLAQRFWTEVMTESNPDVEDDTRELATTLRDWAKKQPRVKQDRFRYYARRIFDRYRKTHTVAADGPSSDAVPVPGALLAGIPMEGAGTAAAL